MLLEMCTHIVLEGLGHHIADEWEAALGLASSNVLRVLLPTDQCMHHESSGNKRIDKRRTQATSGSCY
jgi:hypothetical protein